MASKKASAPKKVARKSAKPAPRHRAKKPTKGETVETSEGVQLLLGNMPSAKDAMFHYQTILALIDKARTASARVSEAKKKAKEANVDVGALMTVMRMERADPLDLAGELKMQAMLMSELGLPVQINLFEPKYGSIEEQAKAEGFAAGKAGRSADGGRWKEGEPGYEEYLAAWTKGQASHVTGAEELTEDESEGEE